MSSSGSNHDTESKTTSTMEMDLSALSAYFDKDLTEVDESNDENNPTASDRMTTVSLPLTVKDLKYGEREVKHIFLVKPEFGTTNEHARVILTLDNNCKKVFRFTPPPPSLSLSKLNRFNDELIKLGGEAEFAFAMSNPTTETNPWSSLERLPYSDDEAYFYSEIHTKIAQQITATIQGNEEYSEKARSNGVLLIAIGTGNGKDLNTCYEEVTKAELECKAIGMDINPTMVEECKSRYSKDKFMFMQADLENIGNTLESLDKNEIKNKLVIIISSGSLTRCVSQSTYSVQKVLQQLAVHNIGDILVSTGATDPLMTHHGARAAGWQTNTIYYKFIDPEWNQAPFVIPIKGSDAPISGKPKLLFTCERQSPEEQFQATLLRNSEIGGDNYNTLQLACTSSPLHQCQRFLNEKADLVQNITNIDLRLTQTK